MSVSAYFTKLKTIWDELGILGLLVVVQAVLVMVLGLWQTIIRWSILCPF